MESFSNTSNGIVYIFASIMAMVCMLGWFISLIESVLNPAKIANIRSKEEIYRSMVKWGIGTIILLLVRIDIGQVLKLGK